MKEAKESAREATLLYKASGPHNGGKFAGKLRTYDSKLPDSPEEAAAMLKEGWFKSLTEAYKAEDSEKAKAPGK